VAPLHLRERDHPPELRHRREQLGRPNLAGAVGVVSCESALQLVVGRRAAVGAHRVEPREVVVFRGCRIGGPRWRRPAFDQSDGRRRGRGGGGAALIDEVEGAVLRAERLVALLHQRCEQRPHLSLLLQPLALLEVHEEKRGHPEQAAADDAGRRRQRADDAHPLQPALRRAQVGRREPEAREEGVYRIPE
jgi:hypothetical protein